MENYGYVRTAAVKPILRLGDVKANVKEIKNQLLHLKKEEVDLAVFPELSLTGYTCADLFFQTSLQEAAIQGLKELIDFSRAIPTIFAVGLPFSLGVSLYNCAAVIGNGRLYGLVPKCFLPNYNEFYEKRWFTSAPEKVTTANFDGEEVPFGSRLIFESGSFRFGVEICEDLWVPNPPSSDMATNGAQIILNLSATDEVAGKHAYLLDLISQQSARCRCGYVYASAGYGESSTDLAFSGNCIIAENGNILREGKRFSMESERVIADIDVELLQNDRMRHNSFGDGIRKIDNSNIPLNLSKATSARVPKYRKFNPTPFVEKDEARLQARCREISSIQAWGLARRLSAIGCRSAVIGISGGLDSTLALLVTVKAFDMLGLDRKGILGVTMPGFGTTSRTRGNAWTLMERLGITIKEVPINDAVQLHFKDINHDPKVTDATYENSQARERTQILMDLANQTGGIVIGTGDLSELALGWCTYNGDQMSMYGVNASIPKTLVRDLVKGYLLESEDELTINTLEDIINTPISPELLPAFETGEIAQKTEDFVGPYELHDFFLHSMLRHSFSPSKIFMSACKAFEGLYPPTTIKKWLKTFYRRFFTQQFKRSCMPDGVKVGSVCLSPRGDWRMPSDAVSNLWIEEVENL